MKNNNSFTEACNFVSLLVQRQNSFLVDIIASGDDHVLEPLKLELLPDPLHGLSDHSTEIGKISGVNTDTNG